LLNGRFIFDSRSPTAEVWKTWTPDQSQRVIEHPRVGRVAAWNDMSQCPASGIVTHRTYYQIIVDGPVHSSQSQIAIPSREQLSLSHRSKHLGLSRERSYRGQHRLYGTVVPFSGSQRTRRWRKQSRANSSRKPQFPVIQGIYREFDQFRPCAPESEVEKMIIISGLEENSLRKGTAK
jgi:hypothetical protein